MDEFTYAHVRVKYVYSFEAFERFLRVSGNYRMCFKTFQNDNVKIAAVNEGWRERGRER